MKIISILKPLLFAYECIRIIIVIILMLVLENRPQLSITLAFTAPGVLFPLMALFIWIDTMRCKSYLPLFIAGKCVYIFILLIWFILSKQVTMFAGGGNLAGFAQFILSGDFFALAVAFLIKKDIQDTMEIQEIQKLNTESEES